MTVTISQDPETFDKVSDSIQVRIPGLPGQDIYLECVFLGGVLQGICRYASRGVVKLLLQRVGLGNFATGMIDLVRAG
jgi:hypothetical protein